MPTKDHGPLTYPDPADQDIVGCMRADGDPETAQDEDPGEEDAGHPSEDERVPGERLARTSGVVSQGEEQGGGGHGPTARQDLRHLEQSAGCAKNAGISISRNSVSS